MIAGGVWGSFDLASTPPRRSLEEKHPMTAENGAKDRDQAESQQNPVQPLDDPEGRFGVDLRSRKEPTMQEQRLGCEQHQCEQQPYADHRVHPPKCDREKTVPQIEPNDHVEPSESGKQGR